MPFFKIFDHHFEVDSCSLFQKKTNMNKFLFFRCWQIIALQEESAALVERIFDKLRGLEMGVEMNFPSLESSGSQVSCQSWELLS